MNYHFHTWGTYHQGVKQSGVGSNESLGCKFEKQIRGRAGGGTHWALHTFLFNFVQCFDDFHRLGTTNLAADKNWTHKICTCAFPLLGGGDSKTNLEVSPNWVKDLAIAVQLFFFDFTLHRYSCSWHISVHPPLRNQEFVSTISSHTFSVFLIALDMQWFIWLWWVLSFLKVLWLEPFLRGWIQRWSLRLCWFVHLSKCSTIIR